MSLAKHRNPVANSPTLNYQSSTVLHDIAEAVASMTEGELGVLSEKSPNHALG
jgi:hypothetical protein